nr:hypothetical protein [Actinoplanes palleronii]
MAWLTWFVTAQVTRRPDTRNPPCMLSSPSALCMPRFTPRCTSSPTEETRVLTSRVARPSSASFCRTTARSVLLANRSLCHAPTSTRTRAVPSTLPGPRIRSL